MSGRLAPLQSAVLRLFFQESVDFRLTGGGALAGYFLQHRQTDDLDLFAAPPTTLVEGDRALTRSSWHGARHTPILPRRRTDR